MNILFHVLLFAFSAAIVWGLSGILVSATERVARRYRRSGFTIAFFVLGLLTSISEISVATNATIEGVPQVSAGNLIGGSLVIFLFIIPFLAAFGGGISMKHSLTTAHRIFLLAVVGAPAFAIIDGNLTRIEGLILIVLYLLLLYVVQRSTATVEEVKETVQHVEEELLHTRRLFFFWRRKPTTVDIANIVVSGVCIFLAGKILVDESIYFSAALSIPPSLIGLLLLSLGTNAPELVIAIRCVIGRHKDIAFGDYMGSAAANTLVMGLLVLVNGTFTLERSEFIPTFFLLLIGLVFFYIFSRSKNDLSSKEGAVLIGIYGVFLVIQFMNVAHFAGG